MILYLFQFIDHVFAWCRVRLFPFDALHPLVIWSQVAYCQLKDISVSGNFLYLWGIEDICIDRYIVGLGFLIKGIQRQVIFKGLMVQCNTGAKQRRTRNVNITLWNRNHVSITDAVFVIVADNCRPDGGTEQCQLAHLVRVLKRYRVKHQDRKDDVGKLLFLFRVVDQAFGCTHPKYCNGDDANQRHQDKESSQRDCCRIFAAAFFSCCLLCAVCLRYRRLFVLCFFLSRGLFLFCLVLFLFRQSFCHSICWFRYSF